MVPRASQIPGVALIETATLASQCDSAVDRPEAAVNFLASETDTSTRITSSVRLWKPLLDSTVKNLRSNRLHKVAICPRFFAA